MMESFSVKAVVRLTGINENTLRGWERRYGAIDPARDEEGRRLYSAKDIERIKLLWSLVKEGHTIGKISSLPDAALKKLLKKSLSPAAPELMASAPKTQHLLSEIIFALEAFDLGTLNQVLHKARFELSSKEIIINLIRPLMEQVGKNVYDNRLTISQEHLLSSLLRDFLGNLNQSLSPYDFASRANAKSIILTTREGDMHEFGILMSSILCNLYRFKTYYLGPNMPVEDLIDAATQLKVNTIVLGIMRLPKDREIIGPEKFLKELDQRLPRQVTICYGGSFEVNTDNLKSERVFVKFHSLGELDLYLSEQT
jgi:MerR family transcriptional regulator, light-induced transcriptional regulator